MHTPSAAPLPRGAEYPWPDGVTLAPAAPRPEKPEAAEEKKRFSLWRPGREIRPLMYAPRMMSGDS